MRNGKPFLWSGQSFVRYQESSQSPGIFGAVEVPEHAESRSQMNEVGNVLDWFLVTQGSLVAGESLDGQFAYLTAHGVNQLAEPRGLVVGTKGLSVAQDKTTIECGVLFSEP